VAVDQEERLTEERGLQLLESYEGALEILGARALPRESTGS
jgi:hypothetical protein